MFNNRNEEQIAETPAASLDEEVMEIPKTQTREKNICCLKEDQSEFLEEWQRLAPDKQVQERIIEETIDIRVPHVMEKTIEGVEAHSTGAGSELHSGANH